MDDHIIMYNDCIDIFVVALHITWAVIDVFPYASKDILLGKCICVCRTLLLRIPTLIGRPGAYISGIGIGS